MRWKSIPNYEHYQVSDTGIVVNSLGTNKPLSWDYSGNKKCYRRVTLSKDGKTKRFVIHRLVAEAFIVNPDNKPQVNHIDGNPQNNHFTNLEWVTQSENMKHAYEIGLCTTQINPQIGENNGFSKLTDKKVIEIRSKFEPRKYTRKMLAEEYGVKESTVKDVILRKTWRHLE